MNGKCPQSVTPVFFGGRLIALQKKSGGIRPIAIGYTWRRLAAKCVNKYAITLLDGSLAPVQLGVGIHGGIEAAVHATRRFLANMPDDHVVVKLDFSNAFNSVRRDAFLGAVANTVPDIYRFCHIAYRHTSVLIYGQHAIESQEGVQQGDPLGPLLFCLAVHPLLLSLTSDLTIGYMDDLTLGGSQSTVAADVATIRSSAASLGLHLNPSKCEVISCRQAISNPQFEGFRQVSLDTASLLGAPLSTGQAMDTALSTLCEDFVRAVDRLQLLSSHDALLLLKNSLGGPKLQYVLRTSPCCHHPQLSQFDHLQRSAVSKICNVTLSDDQWAQASLPVRAGGLGVRSVSKLASSAFLASAAGTRSLQALILRKCQVEDEDVSQSLEHWNSLTNSQQVAYPDEGRQRFWDAAVVDQTAQSLLRTQNEPYHQARLLAAMAAHSGDWLHAVPISACGLRLSDEAVRVAVGLRLGTELCQAHQCAACDATVDTRGSHALSCKRNAGRTQRHHFINDLVWHAMIKAGIPALKEPRGLYRSDGKRPDGLTLIPWKEGRSATWDVTVTDTVAPSYVSMSSISAASAAEAAAQRKHCKYAELSKTYHFFPLAFETMGPINQDGHDFISELGHHISSLTEDPRETSFLYQRLSVAVQRFNAVCLANSFSHGPDDFTNQPKHT